MENILYYKKVCGAKIISFCGADKNVQEQQILKDTCTVGSDEIPCIKC